MLYRISVAERGLTGIANIFRSRLSRLDDLLGAGTVPLRFSLDAALQTTPPFANALVVTHHSPIVCRFAAGSGAGDRGAGPAAGGQRPNPELGIEKPDRQPAARGCVRCRRIEEPGRQPET